jgi:hypothetical protein
VNFFFIYSSDGTVWHRWSISSWRLTRTALELLALMISQATYFCNRFVLSGGHSLYIWGTPLCVWSLEGKFLLPNYEGDHYQKMLHCGGGNKS